MIKLNTVAVYNIRMCMKEDISKFNLFQGRVYLIIFYVFINTHTHQRAHTCANILIHTFLTYICLVVNFKRLRCFLFQRIVRGLHCKVFTSLRDDFEVPGHGKQTAVFEYYFLDVSRSYQNQKTHDNANVRL